MLKANNNVADGVILYSLAKSLNVLFSALRFVS